MFHTALKTLESLTQKFVYEALEEGERCQVFVVIMLDGEIEVTPGSGVYNRTLESDASWVVKKTSF